MKLLKVVLLSFTFLLSLTNSSFALDVCPGIPKTLNWSSSNCTSGFSGTVSGSCSPGFTFLPVMNTSGSQPVTLNSGSCTATISCNGALPSNTTINVLPANDPSCAAPVAGACESPKTGPNRCNSGSLGVNAVQGNGDYHWYCNGSNGGATSPLCWYVPPANCTQPNDTNYNNGACSYTCANGQPTYPACTPPASPDCPVGYYNTNGNGVTVAGRYICFQSGCQYGNQFSSNGFNANGDPIALYTCASGAAANCGQFANVTRLNPPWFDEVTIFDLCSNNSGRDTQNPPSTAQAWNWTCINFNTSNTICTAPRYGCRTVTDSNYTLPQYGASGPANNYGCALTCANGANDYSTCLNVPFGPTGYITGPSTCSILVGASTCSATVSWLTNNPVTTSAITTNVPTNNTILYTANSGGPSAVSVTGGVAQTFYLYNNSTLLDSLTITPTCALGSWDTLYGRCADPRILNPLVINDYYPPGTFTFSCSGSTHYTVVRAGVVYVATTTYTTPVSISGVNTAGNYVLRCLSGNVASDAVVYYNTTPSSPTVSVKITPKTITPGEKVTVSWDTAYPTNACTLTARVVCANNACSAAQLAETSSLNAILNTTTTDNNDPNTSRNLQTAVKTVAPGHMGTDWKALGKKTLSIRYTTDFTYDCGGANKETKRVQVTHSEEQ